MWTSRIDHNLSFRTELFDWKCQSDILMIFSMQFVKQSFVLASWLLFGNKWYILLFLWCFSTTFWHYKSDEISCLSHNISYKLLVRFYSFIIYLRILYTFRKLIWYPMKCIWFAYCRNYLLSIANNFKLNKVALSLIWDQQSTEGTNGLNVFLIHVRCCTHLTAGLWELFYLVIVAL